MAENAPTKFHRLLFFENICDKIIYGFVGCIFMKRCVIVGGAEIKDYEHIKSYLDKNDFFIFCDCGLRHLDRLSVNADLIVGDFDSHNNPFVDTETIILPCEKDDTDTMFGIKEGIKRGFDDFLLIGVVGGRFDHTFCNVSALLMLHSRNKNAVIVDDCSEMEIVSDTPKFINDNYKYFSLLNISGNAKGINIENAKYDLKDGEITSEYQYGVSNEVIPNKQAKVYVKEGNLLLVKILKEYS